MLLFKGDGNWLNSSSSLREYRIKIMLTVRPFPFSLLKGYLSGAVTLPVELHCILFTFSALGSS